MDKRMSAHNISYPSSPAVSGFRSAALRSISLSCRTGNRPQSVPACSFLRVCLESTRENGKNAVQKMEAL